MQPSKSKYIEFESISLSELVKQAPGAVGLYMPARGDDGRQQKSLARIAAQAKSEAYKHGVTCVLQTMLLLELSNQGDIPAPQKLLKITITAPGERSVRGQRYIDSQKR